MEKIIIQISSGRGPVECCRVVAKIVSLVLKEATGKGLDAGLLSSEKGDITGTMHSALIQLSGNDVVNFAQSWAGTVLWVAKSPYRPMHKRKNWYVGIQICESPVALHWKDSDVKFETTRASGPGGQHVNKVETAVRATHLPSGLQVLAMDSRSQLQNRKTSLQRLKEKFETWERQKLIEVQQTQWQEHNVLERGNAVRVFRERL